MWQISHEISFYSTIFTFDYKSSLDQKCEKRVLPTKIKRKRKQTKKRNRLRETPCFPK